MNNTYNFGDSSYFLKLLSYADIYSIKASSNFIPKKRELTFFP